MPSLHELQTLFGEAMVGNNDWVRDALLPLLEPGDLPPGDRIDIYANNITASLTDVLKETFPTVCRLVDESFFSYAACEFIGAYPPMRPCLSEYGAEFAGFLAEFPPTRELAYLPDVARFEWLTNVAAHAADFAPAGPGVLSDIAQEDAPKLLFRIDSSLGYVASEYPIDAIWRANRSEVSDEHIPDLGPEAVHLEIRRLGNDVVFRRLDPGRFAFRQAISQGVPLGLAIERALPANAEFDAAQELQSLFAEQAVAGISLGSIPEAAP